VGSNPAGRTETDPGADAPGSVLRSGWCGIEPRFEPRGKKAVVYPNGMTPETAEDAKHRRPIPPATEIVAPSSTLFPDPAGPSLRYPLPNQTPEAPR
jgi:hypothetical protein